MPAMIAAATCESLRSTCHAIDDSSGGSLLSDRDIVPSPEPVAP
jgi:hypothetical protein